MENKKLSALLSDVEGAGVSSTRFGNIPVFLKSANKCTVVDAEDRTYLDCTSSYGVMGLGYSHPAVIDSITKVAPQIIHTMCEINPTTHYLRALDSIRGAIGRQSDQVIMTTSGSDAVDVAIKLAFRFTRRKGIISFSDSFHGQTINALNVTGQELFRKPFQDILPGNVVFIPYPNTYRNPYRTEAELLNEAKTKLEETICNLKNTEIAIGAVIVEPMQNAAGYILPPKGFLRVIKEICEKHDVLMIDDEIFTGFGRCGKWLMADYEGVSPDIVCVGKVMTGGIPAAACVSSKEIMASLDYSGFVPLHGSTFTGNAIACSSIYTTIDVIEKDDLIEKSTRNSELFRSVLKDVFDRIPQIGDIRGKGSATMIEFVNSREDKTRNPIAASKFSRYLQEKNILTLVSGLPYGNCVAFCMPFIMEQSDYDMVISACKDYARQYKDLD